MSFPNTLHFPSETTIIEYLKVHPLTNNPYLTEKKILQTAAKRFANTEKTLDAIEIDVMFTLQDLNKKINLPKTVLISINSKLTKALEECAKKQNLISEKEPQYVSPPLTNLQIPKPLSAL